MYSSSAIRRTRPFGQAWGQVTGSGPGSRPEGSVPVGLTVDVMRYSSA